MRNTGTRQKIQGWIKVADHKRLAPTSIFGLCGKADMSVERPRVSALTYAKGGNVACGCAVCGLGGERPVRSGEEGRQAAFA